jgi:2-dehydropantoate 2-reductase
MKICVFGAGAVGGHFAAKLAARGHDVSVVVRGANLEAIRDKGITLLHGAETIRGRVRAAESAASLGTQDFVFVTLKANALGAFARGGAPLLKPDTGVVFAQNGIPWWYDIGLDGQGEKGRPKPPDLSRLDPGLRKMLTRGQIVGGVVYSANEVLEPGVVKNNVPGNNMLVVGYADDSQPQTIRALRDVLNAADIASPDTDDIRAAVWAKLVQNLSTAALCTLTGATVTEVRGVARLAALAQRLGAEARASPPRTAWTRRARRRGPAAASPRARSATSPRCCRTTSAGARWSSRRCSSRRSSSRAPPACPRRRWKRSCRWWCTRRR